jgi:dTDP-4-dehydrorhamnose 3,5-epimerase
MKFTPTAIPDVLVIDVARHDDARGHFREIFREEAVAAACGGVRFIQDNQSLSVAAGTLRGLHFQVPPRAQAKLVRCVRGAVLDVALDIRVGSPSFGRHVATWLSADNGLQVFVPVGFAHGFLTLEPDTEVLYKVSADYAPDLAFGVAWDDPDLAIQWGVAAGEAFLSDKDRALPRLRDLASPFVFAAGVQS